jgi:RHS repeat-associated protein
LLGWEDSLARLARIVIPGVPTYDARGNLTSAGTTTYSYSSENRLTSTSTGVSLKYDPLLRLQETVATTTTRFGYDGLDLIAEYNGSNALLRRYVHGPGMDQPLVWYEGTGTTDRRFLSIDERGSVIAVTDSSGNLITANSYDEYGIPGSGNIGRFQYTGQAWLPELGMYYYKARIYSPTLGRFLQTDPIGIRGGINLYSYVKNDPTNFIDPLGLEEVCGMYSNHDGYAWWTEDENGDGNGGVVASTYSFRCMAIGVGNYIENKLEIFKADENLFEEVADVITNVMCGIPAIDGGFGWDGYAGLGGSISGGVTFNPKNGQLSLGFDLGVGVGGGGGVRGTSGGSFGGSPASDEPSPLFGGGMNVNGTLVTPVGGATGSYQLIGSETGAWSTAATSGAALGGNVNISGHGEMNTPAAFKLDCGG